MMVVGAMFALARALLTKVVPGVVFGAVLAQVGVGLGLMRAGHSASLGLGAVAGAVLAKERTRYRYVVVAERPSKSKVIIESPPHARCLRAAIRVVWLIVAKYNLNVSALIVVNPVSAFVSLVLHFALRLWRRLRLLVIRRPSLVS